MWEEQLQVPLLVRVPGRGGRRVAHRVSTEHVAPSLYDALGVARPRALEGAPSLASPGPWVGADYRSYFSETGRDINVDVARQYPELARSVGHAHVLYCGDLKLVRWSTGAWEAYDPRADPTEQRDLLAEAGASWPPAATACRAAYEGVADSYTDFTWQPGGGRPPSAPDHETLRSLGYVR